MNTNICVKKANSTVGILRRTFSYMDRNVVKTTYKTMIRPVLEYGNVVWCPRYKTDDIGIEKVQRRATKLIPDLKH